MRGRPVAPSDHRQNAVTWFTIGTGAFLASIVIGGVITVAAILSGFVAMVFGGIEIHRHRKAREAGKIRRKPKLRTRVKKQTITFLHGTPQGGKAEYKRKHPKPPKPAQPETTPRGKCSVRCRRATSPSETCECVCKGERHGTEWL